VVWQGTAYVHGMSHARGDFIFILDADLSHHVCCGLFTPGAMVRLTRMLVEKYVRLPPTAKVYPRVHCVRARPVLI